MAEENKEQVLTLDFQSVDDFTKNGFKILMEATKISNALPTERDWDFYKIHESFNRIVNNDGDKILRLMNNILHSQDISGNIRNKDIEETTEMVIEANDEILEKVALGIDEMNGIKKTFEEPIEIQKVSAQLPVNGSWNQLNKATFTVSSAINSSVEERNISLKSISLLTAKNIIRPQSLFKDKVDNSNDHPWIPLIKEKPNSVTPLALFLERSEHGEQYSHPYEYELEHFKPLVDQLKTTTPKIPPLLEETPLYEITTYEQLHDLLKTLLKCTEFAVDLEHHSYRTFLGITCLMQISTNEADYLIDTFTLRDKLWILNEVFTKPTIIKVFHGADMDVQWLQRDLALYVVNMFDTHQAAKQLEYSGLSLAYLLNRFCQIVPNKHFQLADWRIRPLPNELKTYARMDTHYLLYIYHVLKNELIKKANGSDNILLSVLRQSTELCKKRYLKPILTEESHMEFYHKCKRLFDNKQMYALKELYQWRDTVARTEDESTGYVLPNHMLLQIADALPREIQGILACCNPIPPIVRANLAHLHTILLKAREQSVVKPILKEDTRSRGSTLQFSKINPESPFHCPHDLSKSKEFRDNFPILLNGTSLETNTDREWCPLEKTKSMYSVFNTPESSDAEENSEELLKVKNLTFLGPYERYMLVKPFIQAEEEKAAAEAEKAAIEDKGTDDKTEKVEHTSQDLTNEDRIAALHAHFIKVTKDIPQKPPVTPKSIPDEKVTSNETFITMGGAKKRKHDVCDDEEDIGPTSKRHFGELHTPVPKWKSNNKQKKKRKWRKNGNSNTTQNLNMDEDQEISCVVTEEKLPESGPPKTSKNWKNKKRSNRRKQTRENQRRQKQNDSHNSEHDTFTPFDYSSVDFQQFQGGAGTNNYQSGSTKSQFKGKNRNRSNRGSNNKSMMFNRQRH